MSINESVKKLEVYKPPLEGRSTGEYLLLDFNERTTPVGREVREALQKYLESDSLQRYPEYGPIDALLAEYVGMPSENLLFTNGSDQGIDIIYRSAFSPGGEAIVPVPSFAMLTHSAELAGYQVHCPTYSKEKGYPLEEVLSLISENTQVVTVCNPNNPTGTLLEIDGVCQIAKAAPQALVLVDECYFEFSGKSCQEKISEYPNICITRTFSKTWGLAALRIGYIIASAENVQHFLKVRGPYAVNRMAAVAVEAALSNQDYMRSYVAEVREQSRPRLLAYLEEKKISYWPTEANLVLIDPPKETNLLEALKSEGILVRPRSGPEIEGTVRISIGTLKDTERVIQALEKVFL